MTGKDGQRGFTLLETLVALAILSSVLIVAYSTISGALKTAFRVAERRDAVEKVQEVADMLRRQPFSRAQVFSGETGGYRWRVASEAIPAPAGHPIAPIRIVGSVTAINPDGRSETVVDTIVLGRRQ